MAIALAKSSLIERLRRSGRFVPTLTGLLMISVGAYVSYYGLWEIRVPRGGPTDPVIDAAAAIQQAASNAISSIGIGWLAVILLIVLGLVAVIGLRRLRVRGRQEV